MSMSSGMICWEEGNDVGGRGVFLRHGCLKRWSTSVSVVIWNNLSASLILWPKRSSFTQSHTHTHRARWTMLHFHLTDSSQKDATFASHWEDRCVSSCSVVFNFCDPMTVAHQAPLSMGILRARILKWVAIPFFPTHGLNSGLQHCRQILYHLSN